MSTIKTYTTRSNARRALANICTKCVKYAKEIIQENADGSFSFDEDKVEELMTKVEWNETYGVSGKGLPDETIKPSDEKDVAAELDELITNRMVTDPAGSVYGFEAHGLTNCPRCNVHLSNGIGEHGQEVNGKPIKHNSNEFQCLACGAEFGPLIPGAKSKSDKPHGNNSVALKASLKLNREIYCHETNECYTNAFQMWKQHPGFMTSGQQDGLTKKLYEAAKRGELITVTVNERRYELTNLPT